MESTDSGTNIDEMTEAEKEAWRQKVLEDVDDTEKHSLKIISEGKELRKQHKKSMKQTSKMNEQWDNLTNRFDKGIYKFLGYVSKNKSLKYDQV